MLPQPTAKWEICTVCEAPCDSKPKYGITACEACKKFFSRNHENTYKLQCITARGDCIISRRETVDDMGLDAKKRTMCSKCRIDKCYAAGMRVGGRRKFDFQSSREPSAQTLSHHFSSETETVLESCEKIHCTSKNMSVQIFEQQRSTSTSSSDSMVCGILKSPIRFECAAAETLLATATSSVSIMSRIPMKPSEIFNSLNSGEKVWWAMMIDFERCSSLCLQFVKNLPGYNELAFEDRRKMFSTAYFPMCLAEAGLPSHSGVSSFFAMNDYTRGALFYYFPTFQPLERCTDAMAHAVAQWKPTFGEYAILQALIFYDPDPELNISNPHVVHKIHSLLLFTLQSFMAQITSNIPARWVDFQRVCYMSKWSSKYTIQQLALFAMQRPDLFDKFSSFSNLYSPRNANNTHVSQQAVEFAEQLSLIDNLPNESHHTNFV